MSHDIDGRHNLVVLCLFCKRKSLIPQSHICKTEKIMLDTLDDASCISKDEATVYNGLPHLHKLNNIQIRFIKAKQSKMKHVQLLGGCDKCMAHFVSAVQISNRTKEQYTWSSAQAVRISTGIWAGHLRNQNLTSHVFPVNY